MTTYVNTVEAKTRAQRALDGMNYNRDAMARDVIGLVAEIEAYRAAAARERTRQQANEHVRNPPNDIFGDMSGIFGGSR